MLRPQQAFAPSDDFPGSQGSGLQAIAQTSARLAGEFVVLQARAAKLMLTDPMQRQQEPGRTFGEPQRLLEMQAIAMRWAELLWLTHSAFIHAFFSTPYATPAPVFVPERRVSARIIRFPERRANKL